jgi:hypothetical protein
VVCNKASNGHSHGGGQNRRHARFRSEGSKDLDVLFQEGRIDGVNPAASTFLVVDQDHGRVFDIERLAEGVRRHDIWW